MASVIKTKIQNLFITMNLYFSVSFKPRLNSVSCTGANLV